MQLARRYERSWLRFDLVAGLVLTALLVPQGMAYAELAGLPPVAGLYATITALLAYALFGPSPTLIIGPDSALAPMTAAAVLPLVAAGGDPHKALELASMLTILVGVICVCAGVARLGAITELLSKPVRLGYLNGLAITVIVGQLPKLFGFKSSSGRVFSGIRAFVDGVRAGHIVPAATIMGVGAFVIIVSFRRWVPSVPGILVSVVAGTIVTAVFDLASHGVPVVGHVPAGLPAPALPRAGGHAFTELLLPAAGIAFVALADTSTLSRSFAAKRGGTSDPTAEIIALGAANVATGLFSGLPVSASGGRSAVAESSGSRSQLTGVVGALAIVLVLLFANGLLTDLPLSILAAIIISSAVRLFDYRALVWMFRVRWSELLLSLSALLGVLLFGVLQGIVVAVALSLGAFVRRAWRPHSAVLGRVAGERGYHDIGRRPTAIQIPGLVVYRFDAPLFFANADYFLRQVSEITAAPAPPVSWVIVAAEPITDIDTSAAEAIVALVDELEARDITLVFAELKGPPTDRLRSYGVYDRVGAEHFFPTLGMAVDAYYRSTGRVPVDWTKQDASPPDAVASS